MNDTERDARIVALDRLANAVGWFFHDTIVHPVTGVVLFVSTMLPERSRLRVAALAHHIHNASAPSNDVAADYAEASARAGHNESGRLARETTYCQVCRREVRTRSADNHGIYWIPVKHTDEWGAKCVGGDRGNYDGGAIDEPHLAECKRVQADRALTTRIETAVAKAVEAALSNGEVKNLGGKK